MVKDGKLGVGVVGLGLVANEHIKGYIANQHCELVAFCSRDKERARAMADKLALKQCRAYDNLEAMLKQDNIDLISICTPNNFHVEQGLCHGKRIDS